MGRFKTGVLAKMKGNGSWGMVFQSSKGITFYDGIRCRAERVTEFDLVKRQNQMATFYSLNLWLPYGVYYTNDSEVLFNRNYNPIWRRDNDGRVELVSQFEFIEDVLRQSYFYEEANVESWTWHEGLAKEKAMEALRDWRILDEYEVGQDLLYLAIQLNDPCILAPHLYLHRSNELLALYQGLLVEYQDELLHAPIF